jgi:hypothetical protein
MSRGCQPGRRGGFTVPELMVAVSIAMLISGTTMLLLIQSAQTNAAVFSDASLEEAANSLQSKITSHVRAMGGGGGAQGAVYTNLTGAVAPPGLYYALRVPYTMTSIGNTTMEEIAFNPNQGQIFYRPDYRANANVEVLLATNANVTVGTFGFFPSIKGNGDNTLDLTLANVELELIHTTYFPRTKTNIVWRTFSVRMRTFP